MVTIPGAAKPRAPSRRRRGRRFGEGHRPSCQLDRTFAVTDSMSEQDHYRQIFNLTRLDGAIGLYDDEASAIAG